MYFEASKKTYYRFPSQNSVNEMDSKYYFPDRPYTSGENTRLEGRPANSVTERSRFAVIK